MCVQGGGGGGGGIKWLDFNLSEHMTAASRSFDGSDLGTYCFLIGNESLVNQLVLTLKAPRKKCI